MPDAQYEKTLSDIAHAKLRDRAPGLLDYLVGFQLLDKSDDDEGHAVGVWGFKVGNEWLYAPVFFLNGQIKGDELLYMKSQDAFVPLQENWINYILNRRPTVLGEPEPLQQNELGIRQPDFNVLSRPPYTGSKYASARSLRSLTDYLTATIDPNFRDFLPVIVDHPGAGKRAKLAKDWSLPEFIKKAGAKAANCLLSTMRKDASFADSVLKFYRMEDILGAARTAFEKSAADGDTKIEGTAPTVRVYMDSQNTLPNVMGDVNLSDAEKERLKRDKYVVRDDRTDEQVSKIYDRQVGKTLQNPHCNGYVNVLKNKSEFKRCLVIESPKKLGGSSFPDTKEGLGVVVDLDSRKAMVCAVQDIYTDEGLHDEKEWAQRYEALPAADSVNEGQRVVFVNSKCQGTLPYRITRKITTQDGQVQLYGYTGSSSDVHEPFDRNQFFPDRYLPTWNESRMSGRGMHCVILTKKPGENITQIGDDLFVPNSYKAVVVNDDPTQERPIDPQTLADVEMELFKSGSVRVVAPITDGIEWWLRVGDENSQPMSKVAMLKHLIVDHGLREHSALLLMKQANRSNPPEFLIKYAAPQAPAFPEPTIATDPDIGGVPVMYPMTDLINANPDEVRSYGEPYMDMTATYQAQQAADQNQREVLDTSIIGGLIKTVNPSEMIDNFIGDLMLGLDRVGRILFMYYWHYEKFKDRYGSQDMPELEDNLKSVFESLGDLTLFLKQKTVEPDVTGATAEAELTEVL